MHPYTTICLIWRAETDAIPIPILGWFESPDAARLNAARVLAMVAPELAEHPVTITPVLIPPEALAEFLRNMPRVKRGKLR
jgi:hypothetical protein